ncbi:MAG: hypothetical protein ACXVQR_01575 [Solirubrobacteraceae bacterium]
MTDLVLWLRRRTLAVDLASDEGLLIYPEGTRCTAQKLARAKRVLAERQPQVAPLAAGLRHVLPPRLGGTIDLIEAAPGPMWSSSDTSASTASNTSATSGAAA